MMKSLREYEFKAISLDSYGSDKPNWNGKRLIHIGVHNSLNKNSGDTLLFPAVRQLFDASLGPCGWEMQQVWQPITDRDIEKINSSKVDALVIGGGGLFLKGQEGADSSASGWQWNCSPAMLGKINKPILIFAVGYNRFRGQEDFDPVFSEHLNLLAKKSPFFGLRNSGSIRAITTYLTDNADHQRLVLQSCPTTVAWQIYPEAKKKAEAHDRKGEKILAFNCAFDRTERRFGDRLPDILATLAKSLKVAKADGWRIVVASHKHIDRQIEPALDHVGLEYESVDLTNASSHDILDFWAQTDLAVGLRGHAQLIPFGLRRNMISIISHDKMRYLLEDLKHEEWGVDVNGVNFGDELVDKIRSFGVQRREETRAQIDAAQTKVWEQTQRNFASIGRNVLKLPPA